MPPSTPKEFATQVIVSVFLVMRNKLILFYEKHEHNTLFFVIHESKVLCKEIERMKVYESIEH